MKETGMSNVGQDPSFLRFASPFAGKTEEECKQLRQELGQANQDQFEESLKRLEDVLGAAEPMWLLTFLSTTCLCAPIPDPERHRLGEEDERLPQAGVELVQALLLRTELTQEPGISLDELVPEVNEHVPKVLAAFSMKRLRVESDAAAGSEAAGIAYLLEKIRAHTQQIRNWGYYGQSLEILRLLYGPLDGEFRKAGYMSAGSIITLFERLVSQVEDAVNEHGKRLVRALGKESIEEVVSSYYQAFDLDSESAREFLPYCRKRGWSLEQVRFVLYTHSFLHLVDAYTISAEEVASFLPEEKLQTVCSTLNALSIQFGELKNETLEHFFLGNPVWQRPLIRIGATDYFCPIPSLFTGFAFRILDGLIEGAVKTKKLIEKRRSQFLEDRVAEQFENAFPGAKFFRNVKWEDGGGQYETDLIVVLDSYMLIVESKSGRVSLPALRGAPDRCKKHILKLIGDPANQSRRLEEKVKALKEGAQDESLEDALPLDFSKIWQVTRLSITLDDFATIQSHVVQLQGTAWFPEGFEAAPAMSVPDLETVLTVLESPIERLHYLVRRAELEKSSSYEADELDLLGFYLETGFCAEYLGNEEDVLFLPVMSSKVDSYVVARDQGRNPEKPVRELTKWWRDVVKRIESSKPDRWSEAALELLSVSLEGQRSLEEEVGKIASRWQLGGSKPREDAEFILVRPDQARSSIMAVGVVNKMTAGGRLGVLEGVAVQAFQNFPGKRCLVILVYEDRSVYPYKTLGVLERPVDLLE